MTRWFQRQMATAPKIEPKAEAVVIRKKTNPYIPQAARYRSVDWIANLRGVPRSTLLRRISGPLAFMTANSFVVFLIYAQLESMGVVLDFGTAVHSVLGSALGLLLVFRTNTAYARFWEGRKIWEKILGLGRELTRNAIIFRRSMGMGTAARTIRYVQAFPYCMIEHLRGKVDKGMRAKLEVNMRQLEHLLQKDKLDAKCVQKLSESKNRPLFIVNALADTIGSVPNEVGGQAMFTNRERVWLLSMVSDLSSSISACERLVQTPVPLSYVRHTSRFLSLFMLTLPYALVGHLGVLVVPAVGLTCWALFGILEIGLIIEDPFQSVLKMDVVPETLENDVEEAVRSLQATDLKEVLSANLEKRKSKKANGKSLPGSSDHLQKVESSDGSRPVSDSSEVIVPVQDDGLFSRRKLLRALKRKDPSQWSDKQLRKLEKIADADKDGHVSNEEWSQLVMSAKDLLKISDMPLSHPLPADSEDDDVGEVNRDEEECEEEKEEEEEDDYDEDDEGSDAPMQRPHEPQAEVFHAGQRMRER